MPWLVAYDVANPRRLRRVARACERFGVRWQQSVFFIPGDRDVVLALWQTFEPLIDPRHDLVQAWPLSPTTRFDTLTAGRHPVATTPAVVLGTRILPVHPSDSQE